MTMRGSLVPVLAYALVSACGADTSAKTPNSEDDQAEANQGEQPAEHQGHESADPDAPFDPPPPASGYMRIVAPVVHKLAPGSNVTYCQYVQTPFDRDLDVLDVQGSQSFGGHHAVAYAIKTSLPVGTSRECTDQDKLVDGFLGGVGGESGGAIDLPAGVAFRLAKGSTIQINAHYVNPSDQEIDGQAVLDFKFVEPSADRTIATLFNNGNIAFNLPALTTSDAVAECIIPREMHFIMFTNHMHEFGKRASTELVHANGEVELLHEDPRWRYDLAFKANFSRWPLDAPLVLVPGDKLITRCHWDNTSQSPLTFPGEMCIGIGFFLSDGASSPNCIGGQWIER
jgi:hypothetical protein